MGSFIKELWAFLRVRKKLWLAPIIIVMVLLGGLLILLDFLRIICVRTKSDRL